jgi:hypothetical protein
MIVCEGYLELFYFKRLYAWRESWLGHSNLLHFKIICNDGKSPESVVAKAVGEARGSYREVWCVFDVERPQHSAKLSKAIDYAKNNKIHVALTYPSFDAWALAHLDPLPNVHENSAKCYKQKLHERLGVRFTRASGDEFAASILGDNCCHVERAQRNISCCENVDEVCRSSSPSTNLHVLVDKFLAQ